MKLKQWAALGIAGGAVVFYYPAGLRDYQAGGLERAELQSSSLASVWKYTCLT